jgi:hypothetical protein
MIIKHPDSGRYWTDDLIGRYAALCSPPITFEEAIEDLEEKGFQTIEIWHQDFEENKDIQLMKSLINMTDYFEGFLVQLVENTAKIASNLKFIADQMPSLTPPMGVEGVAKMARVSVKTVYRWKSDGLLRPISDNRPLLFDQSEVKNFLARKRGGK